MTAFLTILLSLLIISSVSEGNKCHNEGEFCTKTVFQRCCGGLVCDLSGFAKGNQKVLDPYKKAPTNSSVEWFVQETLMRNASEGLFEVDADGVHHIAFIVCFGPAFERKEQIRETGPTTSKAVLVIEKEVVLLEELHQGLLNDLLHDFATDGGRSRLAESIRKSSAHDGVVVGDEAVDYLSELTTSLFDIAGESGCPVDRTKILYRLFLVAASNIGSETDRLCRQRE
nr:unnamed protein product [Spirometra erinaceieuropaei]